MKKTLFLMMVLAGVAPAETVWNPTFNITDESIFDPTDTYGKLTSIGGGFEGSANCEISSQDPAKCIPMIEFKNGDSGYASGWVMINQLQNTSSSSVTFNTLTVDTVIFVMDDAGALTFANGCSWDYEIISQFVNPITGVSDVVEFGSYTMTGNGTGEPGNGTITITFNNDITVAPEDEFILAFGIASTENCGGYVGITDILLSYEGSPSTPPAPEPGTGSGVVESWKGAISKNPDYDPNDQSSPFSMIYWVAESSTNPDIKGYVDFYDANYDLIHESGMVAGGSSSEIRPNVQYSEDDGGWSMHLFAHNEGEEAKTFNCITLNSVVFDADGKYLAAGDTADFMFDFEGFVIGNLSSSDEVEYFETEFNSGSITITGTGDANPENGQIIIHLGQTVALKSGYGLSIEIYTQCGTNPHDYYLGLKDIGLGMAENPGLSGDGEHTITGGELELDKEILEDWTGTIKTDGNTVVSAGNTVDTTNWVNTELKGTVEIEETGSLVLGGNVTLGGEITNNGELKLDGTIVLDSDDFTPVAQDAHYHKGASLEDSTSGFLMAECTDIQIVKGDKPAQTGSDLSWTVDDDTTSRYEFDVNTGKLHVCYEHQLSTEFHINGTDETYSDASADYTNANGDRVTKLVLNGGSLKLDSFLESDTLFIQATKDGRVTIGEWVTLSSDQLKVASDKEVTLGGGSASTYIIESSDAPLSLGDGVKLDSGWAGEVYTGKILASNASLNLNELGTTNSFVQLGPKGDYTAVTAGSLNATNVGTLVTAGDLKLSNGQSMVNDLKIGNILTLGTKESAAKLKVSGDITLLGLAIGNAGSTLEADKLIVGSALSRSSNPLNVTVAEDVLKNADSGDTLTLVTLDNSYDGVVLLDNEDATNGLISEDRRRLYTLAWDTTGKVLTLNIVNRVPYVTEQVQPVSENGNAGVALITDMFMNSNPQKYAPESDQAAILNAVDAKALSDRDAAAVAGASVAVLGQALSSDVDRQLSAIRNRSISGAYGSDTVALDAKGASLNEPSKFFAWVNAEGNRADQNNDGSAAGYTMNSWGGTVGAGMQVNDKLSMGLALTAMNGDVKSDGPDRLDGDMDTTYLSAFARYNSAKWSHAFIGTAGMMDADYKRSAMGYSTKGDTEGNTFGVMYELSYEYALDSKSVLSPVFNVAYRHTEVDAYNETGSDAALAVDDQSLDTVTVGAGARYTAVVGEQTINRACGFEARALVKYDLGDTQTDTTTGFMNQAARAKVKSAEMGAFGLELGAGISVPVGSGSVFVDGAVELRSDYTNYNAAVGYGIQF